jgi:hypothetical protein
MLLHTLLISLLYSPDAASNNEMKYVVTPPANLSHYAFWLNLCNAGWMAEYEFWGA